MPALQRTGDANSAGGSITATPQTSVRADGALVAVNGATGSGHPPCPDPVIHCAGNWSTANGSASVFAEGTPVNRTGDGDTCGHARAGGSGTVFVNEGGT